MRAGSPWLDTLIVLAVLEAAAATVGYAIGYLFLTLWLTTLMYLAWQLQYIFRLDLWLRRGGLAAPPDAPGIWGDVFNNLRRGQLRYQRRRKTLASLLARSKESANAMPDAAAILGRRGELQWWNSAAEQLLGLRWPHDKGRWIDNLIRNPGFRRFLTDAHGSETLTLSSSIEPGAMLEIRVVPYGDEQRLLLVRDITRLHRLENMRRDFIANVSHELRTPLTVVRGLSETLAEPESSLAPEDRHMLELIQQQSQRMGQLVDDLLLLSRLETSSRPDDLEPVDVAAMLHRLREEAVALSGARDHDIRLEVLDGCDILADERELRSAFSNLVFNAVNYTPDGGVITMRWSCDERGAHFSVTDSGVGIAAEHIPRLTERFYRVDRGRSAKTGGTGLGLAIVKHILQRYQARLSIDSELGVGSTFACHFPLASCRDRG